MRRTTTARLAGVLAVGTLAATAPSALATETLVGASNKYPTAPELSIFDAGKPGDVTKLQVLGQTTGDRITGLDVRQSTGALYGQGTNGGTSQNYVVQISLDEKNPGYDGQAIFSPIGARYMTNGSSFGFDFNPAVDRIRAVSDTEQNLRINPNTGVPIVDGALRFAAGDPNAGRNPEVGGSAYIPAAFGGMTTLYNIDAATDTLTTQAPPNDGVLNTRAPLGVNTTSKIGFDIVRGKGAYGTGGTWYRGGFLRSSDIRSFAALQPVGNNESRLYRINLAGGQTGGGNRATDIGQIGGNSPVEALAILGNRDIDDMVASASRRSR